MPESSLNRDTRQDISMERRSNYNKRAKGRAERIRYLDGGHLTPVEAIKAHCYECQNGYDDRIADCENKECSIYPYHPYRGFNVRS